MNRISVLCHWYPDYIRKLIFLNEQYLFNVLSEHNCNLSHRMLEAS